jgi:long-chain fatty acid transport protein
MNVKTLGRTLTLSLAVATTLHATNGDNLIGVGTKSRGMGGTDIGISHGAESGLINPSLISFVDGTEISFGGILFLPDINAGFVGAPSYTSDMDVSTIPEVSIAHKINENWYVGVGIWGTAGLGVDYSQAPNLGNLNMVTNLQLLQFGVPVAYKTGGFSVGFTPLMQYGNLDINYHLPTGEANPSYMNIGAGIMQYYGFGYNLGLSYDFEQDGVKGLMIGAIYKSKLEMNYDNTFETATAPFAFPGYPDLYSGDALEQPAEFGVGISYNYQEHTFAFDYKNIQWSDAQGYGEFGWEDQDVFAFGYQYAKDNWAVRGGYNYAESTVVEQMDPRLNMFNLLGFPATAEHHYTIGMSYGFTDKFSLDLSYVYQPTTTKTFSIAGLPFPAQEFTVDHRETSASFQLTYKF